jgi:hypothetical protein
MVPCSLCREFCSRRQCFREALERTGCLIAPEFQEFGVKPPVSANFSQVGLTATSRPTCPHNHTPRLLVASPRPLSEDDTSAESGTGFFPVLSHSACSKMTLSSLFLRLFILRRAGGCLCLLQTESGALPPHFLFARGSRGGRLGAWAFRSADQSFSCQVACSAAGAASDKNNK